MPILPRISKPARPNLTARTWAPVSYSSSIAGITAGMSMPLPQASLQSGFNTPYLVDEIRMTAYTTSDASTTVDGLAGIVEYQFQTGQYFFSQGSSGGQTGLVPACLYAPTFSGAGQFENVSQLTNTGVRGYMTRRWVLPKPLYMPPGDVIQTTVRRAATIATSAPSLTIQATIVGRALPPDTEPPPMRCVPFVGYYISPSGTNDYSEATQQFENPHRTPWYVQRLIVNSRLVSTTDATLGLGVSPLPNTNYFQLRITDSLGYKITGSSAGGFVSAGDVASANTDSAWTFSRSIPPDEQYNIAVNKVAGSVTNNNIQALISMVGYREEFL